MSNCETIITCYTPGGRRREVKCGTRGPYGSLEHCRPCEKALEQEYPQGWRHYPGDTCKHGRYVGGCGADLMCGPCEDGE